MCCVHNGIISEDELDNYKKTEIPAIISRIQDMLEGKYSDEINASDVEFKE